MAKFPIYATERSVPGYSGSVQGNINPDTGAGMVARGVGALGGAVSEVGSTIFRVQGQAELVKSMAADKDAFDKLMIGFEKNTDPETYDQEFEQMWESEIQGREVKNGWARMNRNQALTNLKGAWLKDVHGKKVGRAKSNHEMALANETIKATETGNLGTVRALIQTEVDEGWITKDGMEVALSEIEHSSQRRQVETVALSDSPDLVLQYKTYDEMKKDYPALKPGDFQDLRATAMGQKRYMKDQRGKWWDGILNDTLAKAQTMSPDEFRSQLQQTPGITEEERTELMQTYLQASKLWQDAGRSPFVVTQNEASLVQAYIGIEDGSITSIDELNKLYLEGKKVNWSTQDMLKAKSAFYASQGITSGEAALYAEPYTQEAIDKLKPLYFDENGNFKDPSPERHTQYLHDRMATIEAIKQNPDNIVKRNAAVEEAQKLGRQAAAKRYFYGVNALKIGMGYWWNPRRMLKDIYTGQYMKGPAGSELPKIATESEFNALPSGTHFIDPEGQERVKP